MALIIVALLVSSGFLKGLGPPSRLALIIGAWLVLHKISESSEFTSVGSAVAVDFDYRGLVCITRGF